MYKNCIYGSLSKLVSCVCVAKLTLFSKHLQAKNNSLLISQKRIRDKSKACVKRT
jgi:hypothetical protein